MTTAKKIEQLFGIIVSLVILWLSCRWSAHYGEWAGFWFGVASTGAYIIIATMAKLAA